MRHTSTGRSVGRCNGMRARLAAVLDMVLGCIEPPRFGRKVIPAGLAAVTDRVRGCIRPSSAGRKRVGARLAAVLAVGDDVTDVDAFRAVAELRRDGEAEGASVAVLGADAPPGLAEAADYAVRDTDDVRDFLLWLADALEAES